MRKPQSKSERIIVDDLDSKQKLIEMANRDGRTIKETLKRVINQVYKEDYENEG